MPEELGNYKYRGARALILLHEEELGKFLVTWREAKAANIRLPETEDSDYASLETLLVHVLRAARGYMVWSCEKLGLPDPDINTPPTVNDVEASAEAYLEHLFERWRLPLANVNEDAFGVSYTANWGVDYCVDAMLEHAVVHPMRHAFQLRNLINEQRS